MKLGLLLIACALAACDSVNDQPVCSFQCTSSNDNACPSSYTCATDGYCHKIGYTGACPFPLLDGGVDLSASVDGGDMNPAAQTNDASEQPDLPMSLVSQSDLAESD